MPYAILIVDDSLPMRGVLKKTIRAAGYSDALISEAENGAAAMKILSETGMDLVITDFNMPVMNGLELIRAIQENKSTGGPPVIVVSTEGSIEKVSQIINQGAAGYLKKPFSPEQLRDLLMEQLGEPPHEDDVDHTGDEFDF